MQNFIDVTEDQLLHLRESLELLGALNRDKVKDLDLYIYGITNSQGILDAAREAIAEESYDENISEDEVTLNEVAVAIPVYADNIYYLTGSGIRLGNEESFVYEVQNEGPRSASFASSRYKPQISLADFDHLSIADSDSYLHDFLSKFASREAGQIRQNVQRTEEATQPGVPAPAKAPAAPTTAPPAPAAAQPKQTSLNIDYLAERLLG